MLRNGRCWGTVGEASNQFCESKASVKLVSVHPTVVLFGRVRWSAIKDKKASIRLHYIQLRIGILRHF